VEADKIVLQYSGTVSMIDRGPETIGITAKGLSSLKREVVVKMLWM
jgi:hypothetical protein